MQARTKPQWPGYSPIRHLGSGKPNENDAAPAAISVGSRLTRNIAARLAMDRSRRELSSC